MSDNMTAKQMFVKMIRTIMKRNNFKPSDVAQRMRLGTSEVKKYITASIPIPWRRYDRFIKAINPQRIEVDEFMDLMLVSNMDPVAADRFHQYRRMALHYKELRNSLENNLITKFV